jgi:hypothetical protein
MLIKCLAFTLCLLSALAYSQPSDNKTQLEKEMEAVNFNSLKNILKKDMLEKVVVKKKRIVMKIEKKREKDDQHKFQYPELDDAWSFLSELWLIKNAAILQWDVSKPEYGITENLVRLLSTIGYYEKRVRVLFIKNPEISHFALPTSQNNYLLVLSIPFIRSMDLSKIEISLLLLEDILRLENGYLIKNLQIDMSWAGTNFKTKGFKKSHITKAIEKMNEVVYKKGFSFQQQFKITKKMDMLLKAYPIMWNTYRGMLKKIDTLVKSNLIFKNYLRLYPSPEMQLKWISPKS